VYSRLMPGVPEKREALGLAKSGFGGVAGGG